MSEKEEAIAAAQRETIASKKQLLKAMQVSKEFGPEVMAGVNRELVDAALELELSGEQYKGKTAAECHEILNRERVVPVYEQRPIRVDLAAMLSAESAAAVAQLPAAGQLLNDFRERRTEACRDWVKVLGSAKLINAEEAAAVLDGLQKTEPVEVRKEYVSARIFSAFTGISGPNEIPLKKIEIALRKAGR